MKNAKKLTMKMVLNNPQYRGLHVIVIAGKVFTAKTGNAANKILDRLEKKYPHDTPAITYIPKSDKLILKTIFHPFLVGNNFLKPLK